VDRAILANVFHRTPPPIIGFIIFHFDSIAALR